MRKYAILLLFVVLSAIQFVYSQEKTKLTTEEIRTQSGIDPTRVNSKIGYSVMYYDKEDRNTQIKNRIALNVGVNKWSFTLKGDLVSILDDPALTDADGNVESFRTGIGDAKFSILNAFYNKGKVALAGSIEFVLPLGKGDFGSGYFSATPAMTLSYTINQGLFLAVQLQYSFGIARSESYPTLSVLTTRIFAAKFLNSGYFFVLEPRPIYNFANGEFDLIVSPLVGKALGKGFNLILLSEIPTKQATINSKGVLVQLGVNKSF